MNMQILFVDTVGSCGGAERSMFELASALTKMTVEVAAVLPEGVSAKWFRNAGIKIYLSPFVRLHKPSILHPFRKTGLFSISSVRTALYSATEDFFRGETRRIIVANNFAALLALDKSRVQSSEFRAQSSEHGKKTPAAEMAHAKNCILQTVWHVRDFPPKWQILIGIRKANLIFAISKPVYEKLCAAVPEKFRHKIHLIPNGIDISRFSNTQTTGTFRKSNTIPAGAKIVTMAANLVPWKRHDIFISAAGLLAKQYDDIRFIIAGSDLFEEHRDYLRQLKQQAEGSNLYGKLLLLGNTSEIGELLLDSDVLVHPTPHEPFGRVIAEAMACGLPVVASTEGGPASIIENGKNGILVKGKNPADWAEAISKLLDSEPLRKSIFESARKHIPDINSTAEAFINSIIS